MSSNINIEYENTIQLPIPQPLVTSNLNSTLPTYNQPQPLVTSNLNSTLPETNYLNRNLIKDEKIQTKTMMITPNVKLERAELEKPTYSKANNKINDSEKKMNDEKLLLLNDALKKISVEDLNKIIKNELIVSEKQNNELNKNKNLINQERKILPIRNYNNNAHVSYISLSSIILILLVVTLLVLKWDDNNY